MSAPSLFFHGRREWPEDPGGGEAAAESNIDERPGQRDGERSLDWSTKEWMEWRTYYGGGQEEAPRSRPAGRPVHRCGGVRTWRAAAPVDWPAGRAAGRGWGRGRTQVV